jgi:fatty acid desaturase
VEATLMALHYPLYIGWVFAHLVLWEAAVFVAVHQAVTGVYFGLSFAPNHKGMPMADESGELDFLRRQVIPTRNLKANPISDYVFGPLGTQIEHHLFPNMARNNTRKARPLVKALCRERGIPYHETGVLEAYSEIFIHLHHVSAPLRRGRQKGGTHGDAQ